MDGNVDEKVERSEGLRLPIIQLVFSGLAAVIWCFFGKLSAVVYVLLGAAAWWIPTLLLSVLLLIALRQNTSGKVLGWLFGAGELLKMVMGGSLLAWVIVASSYQFLPIFAGFLAAQMGVWCMPLLSNVWQKRVNVQ